MSSSVHLPKDNRTVYATTYLLHTQEAGVSQNDKRHRAAHMAMRETTGRSSWNSGVQTQKLLPQQLLEQPSEIL